MKIIFDKSCMGYGMPRHPESPERIRASYKLLQGKFSFAVPKPCTDEDILRAHSKGLLDRIKHQNFSDPDTPNYPNILEHASLAAGAAIKAAELCDISFSLMRPPGHHAGRDFLEGFCYLNNIAIAVKFAQENLGYRKALILDIDCHHGNGTQDIFLGDGSVLYISLHQSPLYPGTGKRSEQNCLNFPLSIGTDSAAYLETLNIAVQKAMGFDPDIVAVSAGFDTHRDDPITSISLETNTYFLIAQMIRSLNKPTFSVLEGGYGRSLPQCILKYLTGFNVD